MSRSRSRVGRRCRTRPKKPSPKIGHGSTARRNRQKRLRKRPSLVCGRQRKGTSPPLPLLLITLTAAFFSCDISTRDLIAAYQQEHDRRVETENELGREIAYAQSLEVISQRQGRQIEADSEYESGLRIQLSNCTSARDWLERESASVCSYTCASCECPTYSCECPECRECEP